MLMCQGTDCTTSGGADFMTGDKSALFICLIFDIISMGL